MPWFLHEQRIHRDGTIHNNGYWEIECGEEMPEAGEEYRVYNVLGGYHYWTCGKDYEDEQNEVVYADGWSELDHSVLIDHDSRIGWLAPDGRFYGCGYMQHGNIADLVLHKSEIELEDEGWVKMYKSQLMPLDPPDYYICRNSEHINYLTDAQVKVLAEKGYKVRPWDMEKDWHDDY